MHQLLNDNEVRVESRLRELVSCGNLCPVENLFVIPRIVKPTFDKM